MIFNHDSEFGAIKYGIRHNSDVVIDAMASQITGVSIAWLTVYSGADHRKQQSSASLAFVKVIHRWLAHSPHKGPVTRKMFPFDDVIMGSRLNSYTLQISDPTSHSTVMG